MITLCSPKTTLTGLLKSNQSIVNHALGKSKLIGHLNMFIKQNIIMHKMSRTFVKVSESPQEHSVVLNTVIICLKLNKAMPSCSMFHAFALL